MIMKEIIDSMAKAAELNLQRVKQRMLKSDSKIVILREAFLSTAARRSGGAALIHILQTLWSREVQLFSYRQADIQ